MLQLRGNSTVASGRWRGRGAQCRVTHGEHRLGGLLLSTEYIHDSSRKHWAHIVIPTRKIPLNSSSSHERCISIIVFFFTPAHLCSIHGFNKTLVKLQLIENIDDDLNGSVASFDHFSMGCHSSGCGINLQVALNRTGFVKVSPSLTAGIQTCSSVLVWPWQEINAFYIFIVQSLNKHSHHDRAYWIWSLSTGKYVWSSRTFSCLP